MKHILRTFFALIILLSVSNMVSAQKFGHLNSAELLSQLPAWKSAEKELETFSKQKESQLANLQQDYAGKVEKLQGDIQSGIITKIEEQTRTEELYGLQAKMQEFSAQAQQEVLQKEQSLTEPIINKIKTSIESVAAEGGFTYIFDTSTGVLLYFPPADDVTAMVKSKLGM